MSFKAVIFDLDGTLLDTLEDIANSMNNVLARHEFPTHDMEDYRGFVGDGVVMLTKRALPEDRRDEEALLRDCVETYRREYDQNWNVMTRPYNGIPETLNELVVRQMKLAVLSNKPHDFTQKCVMELLPGGTFHMVLGQQDGRPQKPDPTGALHIAKFLNLSPEDILYIGDSDVDIKTAIAAEMYPVGALWGFRSMHELRDHGARALIKRPQEILSLVDESKANLQNLFKGLIKDINT